MSYLYKDFIKDRFGYEEFTVEEFEFETDNERAGKLLSELKLRGVLEHVGRGKYRLKRTSNRNKLLNEINHDKKIILNAPFPIAFTGNTAVEIWTGGRYIISPNPFMKVFYVEVRKDDINRFKAYLKNNHISYIINKRVGVYTVLKPVKNIEIEFKDKNPVIPKEKVLNLIREHPALYGEANKLIE